MWAARQSTILERHKNSLGNCTLLYSLINLRHNFHTQAFTELHLVFCWPLLPCHYLSSSKYDISQIMGVSVTHLHLVQLPQCFLWQHHICHNICLGSGPSICVGQFIRHPTLWRQWSHRLHRYQSNCAFLREMFRTWNKKLSPSPGIPVALLLIVQYHTTHHFTKALCKLQ